MPRAARRGSSRTVRKCGKCHITSTDLIKVKFFTFLFKYMIEVLINITYLLSRKTVRTEYFNTYLRM